MAITQLSAFLENTPGTLYQAVSAISDAGVNIEYVYAFTSPVAGSAYVVLRVDDEAGAEAVLAQNGIRTLSDEDMNGLL